MFIVHYHRGAETSADLSKVSSDVNGWMSLSSTLQMVSFLSITP